MFNSEFHNEPKFLVLLLQATHVAPGVDSGLVVGEGFAMFDLDYWPKGEWTERMLLGGLGLLVMM